MHNARLARRYPVLNAYYSAPENASLDQRSYQVPCEPNRYCVAGLAYTCGSPFCWPLPLTFVAREALQGEYGANGDNYYAMRAPGLGVGDVIEIQFDTNTTTPVLNSSLLVNELLEWNCPFGHDTYQLSGTWKTPSLLFVTVTAGYWSTPSATDSQVTRIGSIAARVLQTGDLRYGPAVVSLFVVWCSSPCFVTSQAAGQLHAAWVHHKLYPADRNVGSLGSPPTHSCSRTGRASSGCPLHCFFRAHATLSSPLCNLTVSLVLFHAEWLRSGSW